MPKNKFPDSIPKRELRRQDARRLEQFKSKHQLEIGLSYCGMPSIEFLDIRAWQKVLKSVRAIEIDPDNLSDMKIQWGLLSLNLPIKYFHGDILDFLEQTDEIFDVYNLDFYGGFIHTNSKGQPRCVEAIKEIILRHSKKQASFVLIATFSARDSGAKEYLQFIDDVPNALEGWENVEECCNSHKKNNVTRLKLCFPYFCWQYGMTNNFVVSFEDPITYQSSATMLHFYAEFIYEPIALPKLTTADVLANLANRPLKKLDDKMIERIEMRPVTVIRTSKGEK